MQGIMQAVIETAKAAIMALIETEIPVNTTRSAPVFQKQVVQ